MLSYFSTYGILAYVLNHVRWADLGLKELLKPIYDHWMGLGTSSSPQSILTSNQYAPTSRTPHSHVYINLLPDFDPLP